MIKIPHNFTKKRFTVSVVILLLACAVLYPYLSTRRRGIPPKLRKIDEPTAVSIMKSITTASSMADKFKEINVPGSSELATSLEDLLIEIKAAIEEMPRGSTELTPEVNRAHNKLDDIIIKILSSAANAIKANS